MRFRLLAALALSPAAALAAPASPPAPVASLVEQVRLPWERFRLPNGLTVLVHTDRKAPVVAVSMWYGVGSKHEPAGRTGFAHLFEHLMFSGSAHVRDFDAEVIALGGANNNGSTWFDRTNYYVTVPTGALDRMLFVESDRMGYLLQSVDQAKLDAQRGVVQNEKRQGDNQPFGLQSYYVYNALFGPAHSYGHETIGSMADLDAATLPDVRDWFRRHYGPNNAVLVLAGDIDAGVARAKVERWFGAIPAGPAVAAVAAPVPTLPAPRAIALRDSVPYTRVARYWAVPGLAAADGLALEAAASVIGGLSASRLDNALVRGEGSAVSVSADVERYAQAGVLSVSADVKPGRDPAAVAARLDAIVAQFLRDGPSADELNRVATRAVSAAIGGLEPVAGQASVLAEGQLYSKDPDRFRRDLARLATLTPAEVREAARTWMGRPALSVTVSPGARDQSPATLAITGDARAPAPALPAAGPVVAGAAPPSAPPRPAPAVTPVGTLAFPAIEHGRLRSGVPVYFARRPGLPVVRLQMTFDAGSAADTTATSGLQALTMSLLDEGTAALDSAGLAAAQERLGAQVTSAGGIDRSSVSLTALTPNLPPSLDLFADVVRHAAIAPAEVERLRGQQLASLAAQRASPSGLVDAVLPATLYGAAHPYGRPFSGLGTPASVARLTRDDVLGFRARWLRPETAAVFAVGDGTLADLVAQLDARFGDWRGEGPAPAKVAAAAPPVPAATRVLFVDRPQSPQSVIAVGQVLPLVGADDRLLAMREANDVVGGGFLSRLNSDLREKRGWSYGVRSEIGSVEGRVPFLVTAPVQTDKTGPALAALLGDVRAYLTTAGTTAAERDRTIESSVRELPGQFQTGAAVLAAVRRIVELGRPGDYYVRLADRYRALTAADLDRSLRGAVDPARLTVVVVGDGAAVLPQLSTLGIAPTRVTPDGAAGTPAPVIPAAPAAKTGE